MKKYLSIFLALILMVLTGSLVGCDNKPNIEGVKREKDIRNLSPEEYSLMNLVGTDELGRKINIGDNKKKDKDRYVGLFYSIWLGQHLEAQTGIYNVSYLLNSEDGKKDLFSVTDNANSKVGEFHFWGEPLYGYYNMKDPYVITRHIELLTMAGIDYLCFDATNAKLYKDPADLILNTLLKFQSQGFNVPKIVFYTNSTSGDTVQTIYDNYYQTEKYSSLWFEPNGKPLIIGITEKNNNASDQTKYGYPVSYVSKKLQEFFEVKESEWPNGDFNENSIPWMSWEYPQKIHNGSVAVPVAQHSHSVISVSSMHPECSRGYDNASANVDKDYKAGKSFQSMWDNVFKNDKDINNVLVTSFNEWMAIKQVDADDNVFFVDVYNEEFSRDIEMMKGGYNDNFMLQLASNVRKFKFTDAKKYEYQKMSIDLENDASLLQWDYVKAHYRDFNGDAIARDFFNATKTGKYIDNSNRNDITDIKVVHDATNLYFMVKTAENITEYNGTDKNWMNVLLNTNNTEKNSFSGYNYIINRSPLSSGKTTIERSKGGYNWEKVADCDYKVKDNIIQFRIPLTALGLTFENCEIEFKVSDNVTKFDDIMDYYVSGDSAPIGRLSYSYGY